MAQRSRPTWSLRTGFGPRQLVGHSRDRRLDGLANGPPTPSRWRRQRQRHRSAPRPRADVVTRRIATAWLTAQHQAVRAHGQQRPSWATSATNPPSPSRPLQLMGGHHRQCRPLTANTGYNQMSVLQRRRLPSASGQPRRPEESGGYAGTFQPHAATVRSHTAGRGDPYTVKPGGRRIGPTRARSLPARPISGAYCRRA